MLTHRPRPLTVTQPQLNEAQMNRIGNRVTPATLRRLTGGCVLLALSAITGVISYEHGLVVARETRNAGLVSYLLPLVPDLMIIGSSITLLEASGPWLKRPPAAMAALAAGIGWTVAQNIFGAWDGGAGGRLVGAGIPVAFLLTFESLLWMWRRSRSAPAETTGSQLQPDVPLTAPQAWAALTASMSQRRLAELLDVPRSRVQAMEAKLGGLDAEPSLNGASAHA